jgi:hypothetical protein
LKFLWGTQPWWLAARLYVISNDSADGLAGFSGAFSPQFTAGTVWSRPKASGEVVGSAGSPGCPGFAPDRYQRGLVYRAMPCCGSHISAE